METINYINHTGDEKRITLVKEIGKGAFGVVYESLLDGYGAVAVKRQKMTESVLKELIIEVRLVPLLPNYSILLRKIILNSKYRGISSISMIPEIYVSFSHDCPSDKVCVIYDLIDGFGLDKIIKINNEAKTQFSLPIFNRYINDMLNGLLEIKTAGVAHRDIKPANIMLVKGTLKYIDFGMACFEAECTGRKGSPNYLPPEYFKGVEYPDFTKMDVFAVGVIIMVMITNRTIWQNLQLKYVSTIDAFCKSNSYKEIEDHFTKSTKKAFEAFPEFTKFMPLIITMTDPNPKTRPSIEECISLFTQLTS